MNWNDPRWREVIVLTAGMLADADSLIDELVQRLRRKREESPGMRLLSGAEAQLDSLETGELVQVLAAAVGMKMFWSRRDVSVAARLRTTEVRIQDELVKRTGHSWVILASGCYVTAEVTDAAQTELRIAEDFGFEPRQRVLARTSRLP